MVSPQQVAKLLGRAAFEQIECADITAQVLPSAEHVLAMCRWPSRAMRARLDWTFFGFNSEARRNRQGHVLAGEAYSRGLQDGYFRHGYYRAQKPLL